MTERLGQLHERIGRLTEERDALAAVVNAFVDECGPRFGDSGHQLVGEIVVDHGFAMDVARSVTRGAK